MMSLNDLRKKADVLVKALTSQNVTTISPNQALNVVALMEGEPSWRALVEQQLSELPWEGAESIPGLFLSSDLKSLTVTVIPGNCKIKMVAEDAVSATEIDFAAASSVMMRLVLEFEREAVGAKGSTKKTFISEAGDKVDLALSSLACVDGLSYTLTRQAKANSHLNLSTFHQGDEWLKAVSSANGGLFIVGGSVGMGKSSVMRATAAALVEENPKRVVFEFAEGNVTAEQISTVARLDPDIVFLDELRDMVTMKAVADLVRTGVTVVCGMHGNRASGIHKRLTTALAVPGVDLERILKGIFTVQISPAEKGGESTTVLLSYFQSSQDLTEMANDVGFKWAALNQMTRGFKFAPQFLREL